MSELHTKRKRKQAAKQDSTEKKQKTLRSFFATKEEQVPEPASEPAPFLVENPRNSNVSSLDEFSGINSNFVPVNLRKNRGRSKIVLSNHEEDTRSVVAKNDMVSKSVPENTPVFDLFNIKGSVFKNKNKIHKVFGGNTADSETMPGKKELVITKPEAKKLKATGNLNHFFSKPKIQPSIPSNSELIEQNPVEPATVGSKTTDDELDIVKIESKSTSKPSLPLHPFFMKRTNTKLEPSCRASLSIKRQTELPKQTLFLSELFIKEQQFLAPFPTLEQMHVRGILTLQCANQPNVTDMGIKQQKQKGTRSKREFTTYNDSFFQKYLEHIQDNLDICPVKYPHGDLPFDLCMTIQEISELKHYAIQHISNKKSSYIRLKSLLERLENLQTRVSSEITDSQMWASKYAPTKTRDVITSDVHSATAVTSWLTKRFIQLKKSSNLQDRRSFLKTYKKKKNNAYGDEFDDFIDDGDDNEDFDDYESCSDILILYGPPGSGKSSAVYAAAEELGSYIFELNPSERRSSKKLLEKLGGMSKSHLVHRDSAGTDADAGENYKQQGIVLLDEVDVLFDEDQTFWVGLDKFVETCRRPVILTCEDPTLLPAALVENYREQGFVEFEHAKLSLQVDALWLVSLCEGYSVHQTDLKRLVERNAHDFRSSLNDLQLWCQMGHYPIAENDSWVVAELKKGQLFQSPTVNSADFDVQMLEDSIRTLDIEADATSSSEIPLSDVSLADWCLYADTLSDADFLKTNVFSELAHDFEEEYMGDRMLGLAELTELPERPAPLDFELCIYLSLLHHLPHFLSPCHEIHIGLAAANPADTVRHGSVLRTAMDSLAACNISVLTSGISNLALDAATTSVVATEIGPFVREIARFDKIKEDLALETGVSSSLSPSLVAGNKRGNSRRVMRSALNGMGIVVAKNQRRYLENVDLSCLLDTAPAYWASP